MPRRKRTVFPLKPRYYVCATLGYFFGALEPLKIYPIVNDAACCAQY